MTGAQPAGTELLFPSSDWPPTLFRTRTITKRLFALGGVWLTLGAGVQSSGALCRLADCGCGATASPVGADDHAECSHEHENLVHRAAPLPSDDRHEPARPSPRPCEQDCWCCQPPAPQQPPTPLDADALTQPAATGAALAALALVDSAPLLAAANSTAAPQRAVDACARLCRFLV